MPSPPPARTRARTPALPQGEDPRAGATGATAGRVEVVVVEEEVLVEDKTRASPREATVTKGATPRLRASHAPLTCTNIRL